MLSAVQELQTPTAIGWAAAVRDIEALAARLRSGGYEFESGKTLVGPRDGDRWTLHWLQLQGYLGGVVPWMVKPDPHAGGGPDRESSKCRLLELRLEHPQADKINQLFEVLELRARVERAPTEQLTARLRTPKGEILLGS